MCSYTRVLAGRKSRWGADDDESEDTKVTAAKRCKAGLDENEQEDRVGSACDEASHDEDKVIIRDPYKITGCCEAPVNQGCRSVEIYEKLNKIAEGSYGVVYRARNKITGEIVALKKLKLRSPEGGFPILSLREIRILQLARHENVINVKEIVISDCLKGIFLVMELYEHDLKSLIENLHVTFLQSETKTLLIQLLSAVSWLHQHYIIHRDIKTTNLLLNNRGQLKLADFGLARIFGSPPTQMTQLVVTLWYRAPEILLGKKIYDTSIDLWSVGCVFGELINKEPLFKGKTELDQIKKIFQLLGTPNEETWPGLSSLSAFKVFNFTNQEPTTLRRRFSYLTEQGLDILSKLLTLNPKKRISTEEALRHPYFSEHPLPKDPVLFPTFPSKYSQNPYRGATRTKSTAAGDKRCHSSSSPDAALDTNKPSSEDTQAQNGLFDRGKSEKGAPEFRLRI